MIALIGGTKGGTGKSTLAINFAVLRALAGRDVLLVDTDKQGSASLWAATRPGNKAVITCVSTFGDKAGDEIAKLAPRFQDVLIDAGGFDSVELRSSMLMAEVMVVPARPGVFDFYALANADKLISSAKSFNKRLRSMILLNCMPSHPNSTDAATMRDSVDALVNLQPIDAIIRQRRAFYDSTLLGLGVAEMVTQDEKAVFEIRHAAKEIFQ